MVIAVCETVGVFNTGAARKAALVKSCGISPGINMLKALTRVNKDSIVSAAHKISSKYRKWRQIIRSNRKSKADNLAYQAGAFGVGSKPEVHEKRQKKPSEKRHQQLVCLLRLWEVKLKLCLWYQMWSLLLQKELSKSDSLKSVC